MFLPSLSIAANNTVTQFHNSENCKTYLSFWSKEGESLTVFVKNGKPHFGKFQRYDSKSEILYFIAKEFETNVTIDSIHYSAITKIVLERKKLNMGQFRQATIVGSLIGVVGAIIINKSNSDKYHRDSLKYNNIFLGLGIGGGIGMLVGLIGNDKIKSQKVLECE